MTSFGGSMVKIILLIFNLVLMAIGGFVAYLGFTIFNVNSDENVNAVLQANFRTGSIILIITGGLIFLVATLGLIGACMDHPGMLDCYGYVIFALVIAEIVLFYFGFRYKDDFMNGMQIGIKNAINEFDKDDGLAYGLQLIQSWFKCCGLDGPNDYRIAAGTVPSSCCGDMSRVTLKEPRITCERRQILYQNGCNNSPYIQSTIGSMTYVAYALVLMQLIVILAACCLSRDIIHSESYSY